MDSQLTFCRGAVTSLLAVLLLAPGAFAQAEPGVTLLGGASSYDLSGTGTSWVVGVEGDVSPLRHLGVAPAVRLFRYETQGGEEASFLFPELMVRFQLPVDRFHPYLGGGIGAGVAVEGPEQDDLTLHAALGTFVRLDTSWALRPEFRVRSVDPWTGTTGDFTLGVTYRP